mmetsp:Transcript_34462/g.135574  ORF Transcript_34462/g.135574 Transcript_34462/m.135574 type:complete len:109 (-) Transcript_34462:1265-1591(-)
MYCGELGVRKTSPLIASKPTAVSSSSTKSLPVYGESDAESFAFDIKRNQDFFSQRRHEVRIGCCEYVVSHELLALHTARRKTSRLYTPRSPATIKEDRNSSCFPLRIT